MWYKRMVLETVFFSFCFVRTSSYMDWLTLVAGRGDSSGSKSSARVSPAVPHTGVVLSTPVSDASSDWVVVASPKDQLAGQYRPSKSSVRIPPVAAPAIVDSVKVQERPLLFTEVQVKLIFYEHAAQTKAAMSPSILEVLREKEMAPLAFWRTLMALRKSGKDYCLSTILRESEIVRFYDAVDQELALEKNKS